MTPQTPDVHALSGAYALDALTPQEAAAFEVHLESCESCRTEVRSLREASAALADDVAEAPPEHLRGSVLAAIGTVRPLPPVGADDEAGAPTARSSSAPAAAQGGRRAGSPPPRPCSRSSPAPPPCAPCSSTAS